MMNYEKFDSFITYRITQKYKNEATQISQQTSLDIQQIKAMASHVVKVILLLLAFQWAQCFIPSEEYLVTYFTHQMLLNRASQALNSSYLSTFKGKIQTQYKGILFGLARRPLLSMPVRLSHKSCPIMINICFKVDPGSQASYLATEALQKLYQNCPKVQQTFTDVYAVKIAGHYLIVHESRAHFQNLNILGANFLAQLNCRLEFNYLDRGQTNGQFELLIEGSKLRNENDEL